jgi:hypothetical protein
VYAGNPGTPSTLHANSTAAVAQYDVACAWTYRATKPSDREPGPPGPGSLRFVGAPGEGCPRAARS